MPTFGSIAEVHSHWNNDVPAKVNALVDKGLAAGATFLKNRFQELLSVPAPRVRVKSRAGIMYYRATTRATPGAPPRKLSGRLRAGQATQKVKDGEYRAGTNVVYSRKLEKSTNHAYMMPTVNRWRDDLGRIIGTNPGPMVVN